MPLTQWQCFLYHCSTSGHRWLAYPRIFADFTISKHWSFILTCRFMTLVWDCFMKFILSSLHDFFVFNWNLFSLDQSATWSIVSCKVLSLFLGMTSKIVVSSANFHILLDGDSAMLRLFIMAGKRQGLILVPCGTPAGHAEIRNTLSWYFDSL